MKELTPEEQNQKRVIYESMSARGQKWVRKIGYDNWDPFMKPKEPPFMKEFDKKTDLPENPLELYHFFMKEHLGTAQDQEYNDQYKQGLMEASQMIRQFEERLRAFSDFYLWYQEKKQRNRQEP